MRLALVLQGAQNAYKSCELNNAITWNGLTYLIQKTTHTVVVILLAKTIGVTEFKQWVTINSSIYLLLLWIDGGIKKSIPLYISEYIKHPKKLYVFFSKLIGFYSLISLTVFSYLYYTNSTILSNWKLLAAAYLFFITQGSVAIIRAIFQSVFFNKQFNLAMLACLFSKYCLIISLVALKVNIKAHLIISLTALANIAILTASCFLINKVPKDLNTKKASKNSFAKHTFFMVIITIMKSLTNRNALTLIAAQCLSGPIFVSFKIAQNVALLFYRFQVKAMGSSSIAMLAKATPENKPQVFEQVISKLILLLTPLITFTILISLNFNNNNYNPTFFKFFLTFTIFYIIYSLCSCYEKTLEASQSYSDIIKAYSGYLALVVISIGLYIFDKSLFANHFLSFLIAVYSLKILGCLYIAKKATQNYNLCFNWKFFGRLGLICISLATMLKLVIPQYLIIRLLT